MDYRPGLDISGWHGGWMKYLRVLTIFIWIMIAVLVRGIDFDDERDHIEDEFDLLKTK